MHFTYLFDPLRLCDGTYPLIEEIAGGDERTLILAPVGLFAGEQARPMDEVFAAYASQKVQRIPRLTGQTFSQAYRANFPECSGRPVRSRSRDTRSRRRRDALIAEGDLVVCRITMKGRYIGVLGSWRRDGRAITFHGTDMHRIASGHISET